ncbi:MAG: T9SS type B sorting domain-containing protein [Bacteroidetes bacterium]|nr:T9SS type B sorting domain-containing protein [Bacteroidota bacterium]
MEIQFLYRDGLGNETSIGNRLPNPFTTPSTTVVAQIFNPSNTTCVAEEVITFQVNENPVFDLPSDLVFCQNLGADTIYVTNPNETYDYAWERNGTPIPSQPTQDLIITEGGTYTVTATNPITGCTTTKAVIVDPSEIALFGAEDVTIYDLTGNGSNRIEIDNSTAALGIGNYEFALKLNDDPIGLYQDSPVFENVPPGIHTLYVRDKKGCGIEDLVISVIGYPFYFTPNGDGTNDTWQILGVNASFQPSSLIYIFDRHGRLMAQIPASGLGWNGTYNGNPLPADDYWFRVKLEDGRSFTGHFSLVR